VGQYQAARALEQAELGRDVTLIGLGTTASTEQANVGAGRLTTIRIDATAPDKGSLVKRAVWALGVNWRLLMATRAASRGHPACEVKVTGSPPFFSYLVLLWRIFERRWSVTYRITDFYPETAFASGQAMMLRPITPFIHALRRRADRIEALSHCQARRLAESGTPRDRIVIVRDDSPVSFEPDPGRLECPFGPDETTLLYSGNLGVAHDWQTFAQAYRAHVHSGSNRVRLWLNATGVGAPQLAQFCHEHDLPVHVSSPVPLDQLAALLNTADAHLVTLKPEFWGYVIPSKIYGCLQSGRPILYVGPEESDLHALLRCADGDASVRNGDHGTCLAALEALARCGSVLKQANECTEQTRPGEKVGHGENR
jgi:hypothetical protein